jgi:hypothetical protein
MVIPAGLTDDQWRQVFVARFLPSWKRYKDPPARTSWRAAYFRVLRRLVHRFTGCTHEESWTRFIILHRNGTASLNRIYSRTFDPLEIYAEIRRQNDLLRFRQEVRLVVQLQDVRILMLGSMAHPRSLFVNPNAYTVIHPPGLQEDILDDEPTLPEHEIGLDDVLPGTPPPPYPEPIRTRALSMPLLQQQQQLQQPPSPQQPPAAEGSSSSGFSSFVKRLRAGSTTAIPRSSGTDINISTTTRRTSWLARSRSRESTHGRRPSLSLSRTTTNVARVPSRSSVTVSDVHVELNTARPLSSDDLDPRPGDTARRSEDHSYQGTEDAPPRQSAEVHQDVEQQDAAVTTPFPPQLVYPPLTHPLPAPSHALYPNWTPSSDPRAGRRVARRQQKYLAASVPVGAEWDDEQGWRTWIGPVL